MEKHKARRTLGTCCAAHTLHDGLSDVTYVLLPLLAQTFGLSLAQVGLIRVDAKAGLTAPLDRFVLTTKPRIAALELDDLRVEWGSMSVSAKGSVIADSAGFAQGDVVLRVENWQLALDVAETMGMLAADNRKLWDQAAGFLATRSDGAETIELPLKFENGRSFIGPIPVGPAPHFYLQ